MKSLTGCCTIVLSLVATVGWADLTPCGNAEILALEVTGDLVADPALVLQIGEDLGIIRAAYPELADVDVTPSWTPSYIYVGLTEEAWAEYEAGTYTALDSLNAEYGILSIGTFSFLETLRLSFEACYNSEVLASIYAPADGVLSTSVSGLGSATSHDITCPQLWHYTFMKGDGDCLAGCIYTEYWEFSVIDGALVLLDHYGNYRAGVDASPTAPAAIEVWNTPNPFNPLTMIQYRLAADGWVRLRVYDAKGHLVDELQNEFVTQGDHRVAWDARDRAGLSVASGVYYSQLVVDGVEHTGKMMVMK